MTGLTALAGSPWWYALSLPALALIMGTLYIMIWDLRYVPNRKIILAAVTGLLLASCILYILSFRALLLQQHREAAGFWNVLTDLPWIAYAVFEAVSFIILLVCIRESLRYRQNHLTHDVIRETVNMFPEGISVSAEDGTVLLSNLIMDRLSRELTEGHLSDANRFWEAMKKAGEDQGGRILMRAPEGTVWLLAREQLSADGSEKEQLPAGGSEYVQITAADVTERYRIIDELKEKNARLQDIQSRMKAVTDLSGDMFVAQESAAARAALHNQLGQVLLMGSYFLEHPESADAGMVYMTTSQMNSFLLREAEDPGKEKGDMLSDAVSAAERIGVSVNVKGSVPDHPVFCRLLSQAVRECAANAVKHAGGTTLFVVLRDEGTADTAPESNKNKQLTAVLTNNGRPPKGPVAESGGLLALRKEIEAAGGQMKVDSLPEFRLTIALPVL